MMDVGYRLFTISPAEGALRTLYLARGATLVSCLAFVFSSKRSKCRTVSVQYRKVVSMYKVSVTRLILVMKMGLKKLHESQ